MGIHHCPLFSPLIPLLFLPTIPTHYTPPITPLLLHPSAPTHVNLFVHLTGPKPFENPGLDFPSGFPNVDFWVWISYSGNADRFFHKYYSLYTAYLVLFGSLVRFGLSLVCFRQARLSLTYIRRPMNGITRSVHCTGIAPCTRRSLQPFIDRSLQRKTTSPFIEACER